MNYRIKNESSFKTIINKSKFTGYTFFVKDEIQIKSIIKKLKKKHKKANHFCYAFKIEKHSFCNDDGEPKHSAGRPILNQIKSNKLTDILIVIVRFFGGKKLGIQGLIKAYKDCAIETIKISEKKIYEKQVSYDVVFEYQNINELEKIIKKNNIKTIKKQISNQCIYTIETNETNVKKIKNNKIFLTKQNIT